MLYLQYKCAMWYVRATLINENLASLLMKIVANKMYEF